MLGCSGFWGSWWGYRVLIFGKWEAMSWTASLSSDYDWQMWWDVHHVPRLALNHFMGSGCNGGKEREQDCWLREIVILGVMELLLELGSGQAHRQRWSKSAWKSRGKTNEARRKMKWEGGEVRGEKKNGVNRTVVCVHQSCGAPAPIWEVLSAVLQTLPP